MGFTYEILLAAEGITMAKDLNRDCSFKDIPYDVAEVKNILSKKEVKRKSDKEKIEFLIDNVPDIEQLQKCVDDIADYYNTVFRINESHIGKKIKIRIFAYDQARAVMGDAFCGEIRISFSKVASNILNNIYGDNLEEKRDFLKSLNIESSECLKIGFIKILSHEMFHVFHEDACKNKCTYWTDDAGDVTTILREIFADYFAYSYVNYYACKTSSDDNVNVRKNLVMTSAVVEAARLFGVGKKALIPRLFSPDVVREDTALYNECRNSGKIVPRMDNNGLSQADYAGGYVLYRLGSTINSGVQGRDFALYKDMYNAFLNNNPDEALFMLLTQMNG